MDYIEYRQFMQDAGFEPIPEEAFRCPAVSKPIRLKEGDKPKQPTFKEYDKNGTTRRNKNAR